MEKEMFFRILDRELELAAGCTEPGAIALTGAWAGAELEKLGDKIRELEVLASTNIIKNAMAAGIPGTGLTGIPYAAAIGALRAQPELKLQVVSEAGSEILAKAEELVRTGKVRVERADTDEKLYIEVIARGENHCAKAVIAQLHTHLVLLEADGKMLYTDGGRVPGCGENRIPAEPEMQEDRLTLRGIYDFVQALDTKNDPIQKVKLAVEVNSAICKEGLAKEYGLAIGRGLAEDIRQGRMSRDMVTDAMLTTAAGADARMAGAACSVVANTGSGNQGITATMPVVALARWLNAPEEKMLKAVTLSNLVVVRIKSGFGRLSALCGASVAATGAACGITYLLDGDFETICRAVPNMVGNVAGMLCDGAKADCALKISTCVNAAFQAAFMALRGVRVQETDGIVEADAEHTIDNFASLGNRGSGPMDEAMLGMMLHKKTVG